MNRRTRPWRATLLAGLLAGACTHEPGIDELLAQYFDAYDNRVLTFCDCFHELIGFEKWTDCRERMPLDALRIACIEGIFVPDRQDPPKTFSSAPALQCLIFVEDQYADCIGRLDCGDIPGVDACIEARNEATLACPRLSEEDTEDFTRCMQL